MVIDCAMAPARRAISLASDSRPVSPPWSMSIVPSSCSALIRLTANSSRSAILAPRSNATRAAGMSRVRSRRPITSSDSNATSAAQPASPAASALAGVAEAIRDGSRGRQMSGGDGRIAFRLGVRGHEQEPCPACRLGSSGLEPADCLLDNGGQPLEVSGQRERFDQGLIDVRRQRQVRGLRAPQFRSRRAERLRRAAERALEEGAAARLKQQ